MREAGQPDMAAPQAPTAQDQTAVSYACSFQYNNGWLGLAERHGGEAETFLYIALGAWVFVKLLNAAMGAR